MTRFVWTGAAALVLAAGAAPRVSAQQKVNERHAVTPDFSFRVKGSVGALRLTGWTRDSLVVTGTLPPGVRLEFMMGGDGTSPARGAKMYLEAKNDAIASGGTLEIRVPRRARVWIKAGTANVEARDLDGGLDVSVIGGTVSVAASPRELQVEAMDAGVTIDGTPAWLRAKTATGDITVRGGSADLALTTVSGAIRLEQGTVERARLESVTGAIHFLAATARGGDVSIDSHSGAVDVALPRPGGFLLFASSITGAIENRYDRTRTAPGREGRGGELTIEHGDSPRLTARTFKGTITVGVLGSLGARP